jgi:alkaline phosphatase D
MDRRQFLRNTLISISGMPLAAELAAREPLTSDPFTLGVASGDVSDSSSVLWTRLAPEPQRAGGGMPGTRVLVDWELSLDPEMSTILRRGQTIAVPELAHSVHVELDGLESTRDYWYRFSAGGYQSRTGHTRTLPGQHDAPERARFVTASCQNFTHGHFVAYRHMVEDDPDFVIHLGDYIYDTSFGETFRKHPSENAPQALNDFRRWHALYKSDRDLQAAHAAIPFFASIDNHDATEDNDPSKAALRAAAYQAWYEHMPVRGYTAVGGNAFDIHRCIALGSLAQICMLDSRQFRDRRELCSETYDPGYGFGNYRKRCAAIFAEERTMLGAAQEHWLIDRLTRNSAAWNVIASPGPFLPFSYRVEGQDLRYIGAWDSYPANRERIANALVHSGEGHPLILSGDVHSFWAVDGSATSDPQERFPVVEFVTSSISANWPPALAQLVSDNLEHNPQVNFYDPAHRGYLLHELTPQHWHTSARGVDDVRDEQSGISTVARFTLIHAEPGLSRAE